MKRLSHILVSAFLCLVLSFWAVGGQAETITVTKDFDSGQAITIDIPPWQQCVSALPTNAAVESVEIEVVARISTWGSPARIDLLCNDTSDFSRISSGNTACSLTSSTNPNPSKFSTTSCSLTTQQITWLTNNKCIYFAVAAHGATYFVDRIRMIITLPKAATPVFSPAPGFYAQPPQVAISCSTPGATITYTLDGTTEPTEASMPYTAPIQVANKTIKAKAFRAGWLPSDSATGTYETANETTLYLREAGTLSAEPGRTPGIPFTMRRVIGMYNYYEWQGVLEADISSSFFYSLDILNTRTYDCSVQFDVLVNRNGELTPITSQTVSIPSKNPMVLEGTIQGPDVATGDGDLLILRLTLIPAFPTETLQIGIDSANESYNSHIKIYYNGPVACFSYAPDPSSNVRLTFDASCSYDPGYSLSNLQIRWDWDNDGQYDTDYSLQKTVLHQFPTVGVRTVKLQVKNPAGLTRTTTKEVATGLAVLSSFQSPGPAPAGLAWDGSHLRLSDTTNNSIRRLTTSGAAVSSFAAPCDFPVALAWDGQSLWLTGGDTEPFDLLYKLDPSGNGLSMRNLYRGSVEGLTFDGLYLWGADETNREIFKLDQSTYREISSFDAPGWSPRGLAWDGQYLWNADYAGRRIYKLQPDGTVVNSFAAPAGGKPWGLSWDGNSLWCVNDDDKKIYRLAERIPTTITCEPSRTSLVLGERLTVSGRIDPASGQDAVGVTITLIPPTGDPINKPVLANINGEFTYELACGDIYRAGTWKVQTSWVGDELFGGATSAQKVVSVNPAQMAVTVNITSQAIKFGEAVDISGKITPLPDCGRDLSGIAVELHISGPGGASSVLTVQTNDRWGHYVLQDYTGFTALGEWTVEARFSGGQAYLSSSSPSSAIRVVETAGYAIVVQGKISSAEGLASHNKTANFVYQELRSRGLLDNDIKYFNYDSGQAGVDAVPTKAGIQEAITQWARDKMNAKPANLHIVMVDHGFVDTFYIHPETITPAELAAWLDTLQGSLTGQAANQEIIVILGFCRAGSFIDELSNEHRVIIASAAENESSYKGPLDSDGVREGEYFISEFFKSIAYGKSVKAGFEESAWLTRRFTSSGSGAMKAPYHDDSWQHPLLDDNGDSAGSADISDPDGDGSLSRELFIGVSTLTGNDPGDVAVTNVTPSLFLTDVQTSATLWARVDNNSRLDTLWIEVKPPGYSPVDPGGSGQAEVNLPRSVYQTYNQSGDRYEWTGQGSFALPGTYQVFYFAKDTFTGNVSPLRETMVYKAKAGNYPPQPFSLLAPLAGETVLTTIVLDWEDTTDPNGDPLTYNVLLSKGDPSFANPIKKEGLSYSTCLVSPADGIEDLSDYHWKVQAIDPYGAPRETSSRIFHTNNTNPVAAWLKGHVYNAISGQPLPNAAVAIGGLNLTTAFGGYYLGQVVPGTYTITTSATAYLPKTYTGVVISDAEVVTKDFPMLPQPAPGDINGDLEVGLADAILVFQVLAGMQPPVIILKEADINGDGKIGLAEAIYIIQKAAGLRP